MLVVGDGDGGTLTFAKRESMAELDRWDVGFEDDEGPGEGVMLANSLSTSESSPPDDGAER